MNNQLLKSLHDGIQFFQSQGRQSKHDRTDEAENLLVSALIVLASSSAWPRYAAWIRRHKAADAIRRRRETFKTRKWGRIFGKLLRLAVSDLEALPGRILPPTPLPLSGADRAKRKRVKTAETAFDDQSYTDPESARTDPIKQGVFWDQIATFENPAPCRESQSVGVPA